MKTIKFLTAITAVGIAVAFYSCSKGAQGEQGIQGTQGIQGNPGAPGNANVKSNTWNINSWSNNGSYYYINLADANITSAIQNNGTVEAFLKRDAGTTWIALPFTQYDASADYFMNYYRLFLANFFTKCVSMLFIYCLE